MRIRVAFSLFLTVQCCLAAAAVVSFLSFGSSLQQRVRIVDQILQVNRELDRFLSGSRRLTSTAQAYAVMGNPTAVRSYWQEVSVARNRERAVAALRALDLRPAERRLLEAASRQSTALSQTDRDAFAAAGSGDRQGAMTTLFGVAYQQDLQGLNGRIEGLKRQIQERLEGELRQRRLQSSRLWTLSMLLLGLSIASALLPLLLFVPGFILQPLRELDRRLRAVMAGEKPLPLALPAAADELQHLCALQQEHEALVAGIARDRWVKQQQAQISEALQRQRSPHHVLACLLSRLASQLPVAAATAYVVGNASDLNLNLAAAWARAGDLQPVSVLAPGEGLVGQCMRQRKPMVVVPPAGYMPFQGGLGSAPPSQLQLLPVLSGDRVLSVLEIALLRDLDGAESALLHELLPFVALALERSFMQSTTT